MEGSSNYIETSGNIDGGSIDLLVNNENYTESYNLTSNNMEQGVYVSNMPHVKYQGGNQRFGVDLKGVGMVPNTQYQISQLTSSIESVANTLRVLKESVSILVNQLSEEKHERRSLNKNPQASQD